MATSRGHVRASGQVRAREARGQAEAGECEREAEGKVGSGLQARGVLAGRELGRDCLGYAQAVDGSAHDAARVTRAFAARIDASGRFLVRIGQIACQSRLKVLPTNHADGA